MRNTFTKMKPDTNNLVTQHSPECAGKKFHNPTGCTDIMCVECGFAAHCFDAAVVEELFENHACRLVSTMVSTSD
jgi:hypothetical protein